MRKIDLTGDVYGDWLVIKESDVRKSKKVYWECQCLACGKIQLCSGNNLRTGKTTNCGCRFADKISAAKVIDLTGKKFGMLTVLGRAKSSESYGRVMWLCQCDCGSKTVVAGVHLTQGNTVSCGCCNKSKGEARISELLEKYDIPYRPHYYVNSNGRKFYFDFFVDDRYFIEYDGIQHYKGWFRDANNLLTQQEHDAAKTQYCEENGIPLIRIPYTRYKVLRIEDLLLKETDHV